MKNNPINFNDPTGHRTEEGCGAYGCKSDHIIKPKPKHPVIQPSGTYNLPSYITEALKKDNRANRHECMVGCHNGSSSSSGYIGQGSASNPWNSYNYAAGTPQVPLYESHSPAHDIFITGQTSAIYSNGSSTTVSLFPPSVRQTSSGANGLSSNFAINPDMQFTTGYGQSVVSDSLKTLTGINIDPITGALVSRVNASVGPITLQSQIRVEATFRPVEAAAASVAVLAAFAFAEPSPLGEAGLSGGAAAASKLCFDTGLCRK